MTRRNECNCARRSFSMSPVSGKTSWGSTLEIAVEREGAFGGPPLVNRHLAGTREVGDLLDREATHPFGEKQFGRGIEDLLAHFSGRAPSASAPGSIGHENPPRKIYGQIIHLMIIWTHRTQVRRQR